MRAIIALLLCVPLLFAGLVSLPAPVVYPTVANVGWRALGMGTSKAIADDADLAAVVFNIPISGTAWTGIQFSTGTITTGDTAALVRAVVVDGSGNPDNSTLYAANSNGTVNIASADDNVALACTNINSGTGVACTAGDLVAVTIGRTAATGTLVGGVLRSSGSGSTSGFTIPNVQDYDITSAAAWTKTLQQWPILSLQIDGTWVPVDGCLGGVVSQTTESFQSAAEKGILINLPVSVRIMGAVAAVGMTAATTVKMSVYSAPTTSPSLVVASAAIDTDTATVTTADLIRFTFTAPATLAANTDYVVALSPQGAVNVTLSYLVGNATYRAAYPTGTSGTWFTRASGGATVFTETTTRVPSIGIVIDQISTGGGEASHTFIADALRGRNTRLGR